MDSAFVYTFARYDMPHRSAAHEDLDCMSRGVVKVLNGGIDGAGRRYPDMLWEPKVAFDALAECYAR